MNSSNLRYHCLGNCFNQFNDFFNKQTWSFYSKSLYLSGWDISISSWSLPCKKAVLTTSWSSSMSWAALKGKITLIDACLTTRENTSLKSTPSFCAYPFATNLALNLLGSDPIKPYFALKIHLHPTTLLFACLLTNSKVSFLYREFMSSSITFCHLFLKGLCTASLKVLGSSLLIASCAETKAKGIRFAYQTSYVALCIFFLSLVSL